MYANLKNQVERILKEYPETRNSDITLTIKIWEIFYAKDNKIDVRDLYELPREDNIKRIRAKFCQEKKPWAYPTEIKIMRARRIKEIEWRIALGYKPPEKIVHFEVKDGAREVVKSVSESKIEEFLKLNPNALRLS